MKLILRSMVGLCLSLLMMLTSSTAQATLEGGLLLKESAKSPFTGVLLPEWQYRSLVADAFTKTQFEQEIDKCHAQVQDLSVKPQTEVLWFGAGSLLTLLLMASAKK